MSRKWYTLEELAIAAGAVPLGPDDVSGITDEEVEEIFLNTVIRSREDIEQAIIIMAIHRPKLLQKIEADLKNRPS